MPVYCFLEAPTPPDDDDGDEAAAASVVLVAFRGPRGRGLAEGVLRRGLRSIKSRLAIGEVADGGAGE